MDVRTLDLTDRSGAQDAYEVGADFEVASQFEIVRHDGPPLDRAPRDDEDGRGGGAHDNVTEFSMLLVSHPPWCQA
jgi:hypothetical protein